MIFSGLSPSSSVTRAPRAWLKSPSVRLITTGNRLKKPSTLDSLNSSSLKPASPSEDVLCHRSSHAGRYPQGPTCFLCYYSICFDLITLRLALRIVFSTHMQSLLFPGLPACLVLLMLSPSESFVFIVHVVLENYQTRLQSTEELQSRIRGTHLWCFLPSHDCHYSKSYIDMHYPQKVAISCRCDARG